MENLHTNNQFALLLEAALSTDNKTAWRFTAKLFKEVTDNDKRLKSHVNKMISILPKVRDNHQRELLRVLNIMEINDKLEGSLFNSCIEIWKNTKKIPSVRICAFKLLKRISDKYPELNAEVALLASNQYTKSLSPGIKISLERLIIPKTHL